MKRGGLLLALGATFAVAGLVVFGLYRAGSRYLDLPTSASELPAALDDYRKDGLPLLAHDIAPPRLTAGSNAANAIRAAAEAMPTRAVNGRLTAALRRPGPASDALVRRYRIPLDLVAKASGYLGADFRRDWDLGIFVRFPESAAMRSLARAACLRAVRAADRGDDEAALGDLELARRLAIWTGSEPSIIPMLMRISLESIALEGAERCMVRAVRRPAALDRYRRWLLEAPPMPRLMDALRGEAFFGITECRNLAPFKDMDAIRDPNGERLGQVIEPFRLQRTGLPRDSKARAYLARHFQLWHEAYKTTKGFQGSPEEVGRRLDAVFKEGMAKPSLSYALVRASAPDFGPACQAITSLEARRVVRLAFAAALVEHARSGRWPKELTTPDPFGGGSLRSSEDSRGFRIWSVGRDHRDDGGLHRWEAFRLKGATSDEVAAYPSVR